MLRKISVGLVVLAEAAGAFAIHAFGASPLAALGVIVVVVLVAITFFDHLEGLVVSSDRLARRWGAKLGNDAVIHGYWFTRFWPVDPTAPLEGGDHDGPPLGASVIAIEATSDAFKVVGDSLLFSAGRWERWSGEGRPFGDHTILFGYDGVVGVSPDDGHGSYRFESATERPDHFTGGFWGQGLHEYRTVVGERCNVEPGSKKQWKDREFRKRRLEDRFHEYLREEQTPVTDQ